MPKSTKVMINSIIQRNYVFFYSLWRCFQEYILTYLHTFMAIENGKNLIFIAKALYYHTIRGSRSDRDDTHFTLPEYTPVRYSSFHYFFIFCIYCIPIITYDIESYILCFWICVKLSIHIFRYKECESIGFPSRSYIKQTLKIWNISELSENKLCVCQGWMVQGNTKGIFFS